jgi:2Fe-2S ferredoxin
MPKIKYIEHNGKEHDIDVPIGWSVMEGAVKNRVPGIDADCGGGCACATCHIYVDEAWVNRIGEKEYMERAMLDFAQGPQKNSRLSCQVKVTAEMDGLIVRMPRTQH